MKSGRGDGRAKGRTRIMQDETKPRIAMSGPSAFPAKFGHCAPDQSAEPSLVAYRGAQYAPLFAPARISKGSCQTRYISIYKPQNP